MKTGRSTGHGRPSSKAPAPLTLSTRRQSQVADRPQRDRRHGVDDWPGDDADDEAAAGAAAAGTNE